MAHKGNDSMFVPLVSEDESERETLLRSFFNGEVALWASRRAHLLGDLIIPKHMYIEWIDGNPHKVAWVEHWGINTATEERDITGTT